MRFDDLKRGQVITTGTRYVSEQEIVQFANRYDPQWFHTDPVRAKAGRWKGLIASGWLTCSIAMELVVRSILENSESFGSPGVEQLQWLKPLRPGDEVKCEVEVLDIRRPGSNTGSVRWRWTLIDQHDERVLELLTTSLFDLHRPGTKVLDRWET